MPKKYAVLRLKMQKPEGGLAEAFDLGLAELGCWGNQHFDAGRYPFPDEAHAFALDWLNLCTDFEDAVRKIGTAASPRSSSC